MSGEAHNSVPPDNSHHKKKESSGKCPDMKINGGEGECKDCGRKTSCSGNKKAKEGSGHVNEPLTKEEQERLDNQQFFIGTGNRHYYVKTIG
nr:hypothetical protein [Tanacetum cinerariifolium]